MVAAPAPTADGPPPATAALATRVDAALAGFWDVVLPRLVELDAAMTPLADELRAFTAGGKRLRPILLLLGAEAAGLEDPTPVHGAAIALELLHTCALLHDDIIDAAPERRGRTTTHLAFADAHRAAGWEGSPEAHGEAVAILLGDLAFVHADEAFLTCDVPAERLLAGFRHFTVLREEVMAGQYLDVLAGTTRSTSRDTALRVATLKSGRYSVARPLEIGALLAGGDPGLVAGLHAFGDPLGRAFQVRDDLLGVFGDPNVTGKSDDGDLREGKRTLLVAETVARLGPTEATRFQDLLGRDDLRVAEAEELRAAMVSSGGRTATEAYVDEAIADALAALDVLDVPSDLRTTLAALARWLGARSV